MRHLDVVAVGHALVDIRILVDRFPRPDEEAEIVEEARQAGGSAVNVSIDVSKLGGRSGVIAKISFDSFGRIVFEELWRAKVDVRGLRITPTGSTGFSIIIVDKNGNIVIYGTKGVAETLEPNEVDEEIIADSKVLHIASLRPDTSLKAAKIAKESGVLVSWDPGRRLAKLGIERLSDLLSNVDIVFLNRLEAKTLTGLDVPEAAKVISERGPQWVVVKLGAEGALFYSRKGVRKFPALKAPRVVDTTGAGDALAAATLLRVAQGDNIEDALKYGMVVASVKVSRLGSHNLPEESEIEELLKKYVRLLK
jgi:ribokinase